VSREKLPALQFYPGDWRKDPGVQALDFHDRGVWFELLCMMHESSDRGRLTLNGRPMPDAAIARNLGIQEADWKQTRSRLEAYGVASVTEDGTLFNRRMVKDEAKRERLAEAGRKGGKKSKPKPQRSDGEANEEANPSPSVSSSTSVDPPVGPPGDILKRKSRLPSDWLPTARHRERARTEGLDCDREAEVFREHHQAKGTLMLDWDRAFTTWLLKAPGFNGGAKSKKAEKSVPFGSGTARYLR